MAKLKKILLKAFSFVFAISAFAVVATLSTNLAKADDSSASPSFVVNQTTAVRMPTGVNNDDAYGLKFSATVNGAWYTANVAEGESVTFGLLVYPKANATGVDFADTTLTIDAYETALSAVKFAYPRESVNGSYYFTGAVTYSRNRLLAGGVQEERIEDALNYFYSIEMEARAYAQVGDEIIWADTTYATSMRKTALLSIAEEESKENPNEDIIGIYDDYTNIISEHDIAPVVAKDTGKFFELDVEDGKYELYTTGKVSIPVSVVNGVLTADDPAVLQNIASGDATAYLFIDGNDADVYDNVVYKITFTLADKVITTAEEFAQTFQVDRANVEGYYALGNDIDLEGVNFTPSYKDTAGVAGSHGLTGTFDGRGYAIKNFKFYNNNSTVGIFGNVHGGAVIKNLAVTDFWDNGYAWTALIIASKISNATVENVYARPRPGINGVSIFGMFSTEETTFKNVVFDYQPDGTELDSNGNHINNYRNLKLSIGSYKGQGYADPVTGGAVTGGIGSYQGLVGNVLGVTENVYMVSPYIASSYGMSNYSETHVTDGTNLNYEVVFASNDNEMPYLTTTINGDGSLTHKRIGYPEDIVSVLNEYNKTAEEKYEFDPENLKVDDFIKYSEVDNKNDTKAKRITSGFNRYNTYAEMSKANNDLSAFENSKYWSVVNGCPVWAGEVDKVANVVVGETELAGSAGYVTISTNVETAISVKVGGANATVNSITVANDDYVSVDGNDVTGVSAGLTTATINYTFGGKSFEKVVTINVVQSVIEVNQTVMYDASDNKLFYDLDGDIISGYVITENGKVDFNLENGFTYVSETNSSNVFVAYVTTANATYKFNAFEYWDFVIEDNVEYSEAMSYTGGAGNMYKKYIALGNDVDMLISADTTGYVTSYEDRVLLLGNQKTIKAGAYRTVNHDGGWGHADTRGFVGVFDGKGYTVDNFVNFMVQKNTDGTLKIVYVEGVLHQVTVTEQLAPVFKNVAYTNMVASGSSALIAGHLCNNYTNREILVENVYIHLLAHSWTNGLDANGVLNTPNGNVNVYAPNALFTEFANVKMNNVYYESLNINYRDEVARNATLFLTAGSHNTVNPSSGKFEVAPTADVKYYDEHVSNVVYLTNSDLYRYGFATTSAKVDTAISEGKYPADALLVFGANDTTTYKTFYHGIGGTTTQLNADISGLTAGDASTIASGVYKMKNLLRYSSTTEMANDAGRDFSGFTNTKYWVVNNGILKWAGAAKAYTSASINGAPVSTEVPCELEVDQTATVTINSEYASSVEIVVNGNVATVDGNVITAVKPGTATYVVTATVNGVELSYEGALTVNKKQIVVSDEVNYFKSVDYFGFNIEGTIVSATATYADGEEELNVSNGIILTELPLQLVVNTETAVYTFNNIAYSEEEPTKVTSNITYNKSTLNLDYEFDATVAAAYYTIGNEKVAINVVDGKLDIPAIEYNNSNNNVISITVITNNEVLELTNVEYWDKIIYEVRDLTGVLDYTSSDKAVLGWYALGNDINFRLADNDAYVIQDLKHEYDIQVGDFKGIYYILDRFNGYGKSDPFTATSNSGFGGMFDGKGYAMYNFLSLYRYSNSLTTGADGLFGKLYSTETTTPVVKNFALLDMITTSGSSVLADCVSNVGVQRIENVYLANKAHSYVQLNAITATNVTSAGSFYNNSAYALAGIVRNVGHTYMTNVVAKFKNQANFSYNVYPGNSADTTQQGSLASTYNKVDETQTIASYDANYLSNVIIVSPQFLTTAYMYSTVGHAAALDTNGRGEKSYVAYGNDFRTAQCSAATPQSYTADGSSINKAADNIDDLVAGNISALASKGMYRFENVYHYNSEGDLRSANGNRENPSIITLLEEQFANNSLYTTNTVMDKIAINWAGIAGTSAQITVNGNKVDNALSVYSDAGELNVAVTAGNLNLTVSSIAVANGEVATESGSKLTVANVGTTLVTVTYAGGDTTLTKSFTLNVMAAPIIVDSQVPYYSLIKQVDFDFADEIVSAKYVTGETETEFDITYGLIIPEVAFDADYISLSTATQEYRFTNLVLDNEGNENSSYVLYDAKGNGFTYTFDEGATVEGAWANGKEVNVVDGNIVLTRPEVYGENVYTVDVLLNNGVVKFTNVNYFDHVVDSAIEWLDIFGYIPTEQDGILEDYITLSNNISFKVDEVTEDIKDYVVYVNFNVGVSSDGVAWAPGAYLATKNGYSQSWGSTWAGFAGYIDGRGYGVDYISGFDKNSYGTLYMVGGAFNSINLLKGHDVIMKNVAFTNIIGDSGSIFAQHLHGTEKHLVLENVYISLMCQAYKAGTETVNIGTEEEPNNVTFNKLGNANAYSPSGLIPNGRQDGIKLINVLYESNYCSQVAGAGATNITGALYKPELGVNPADVDANCTNVIFVTKQLLSSQLANYNIKKGIDEVSTASGEFVAWKRGTSSYAANNASALGVLTYGANETTGTYNMYQGYKDTATYDLVLADLTNTTYGTYQIWAKDDLTNVTAGDTSFITNGGMYKFANVLRYDDKNKLAADKDFAPSILANFTSSVWNVNVENGTISWARYAQA
ncbi:MAG: hypothetical protein IKL82_04395 [Clostridia bacterium]|nr:hypothetical protein [Clostridia bacterium]